MIFRKHFERNLIRAELDTSGEYAILRLEIDPLTRDKREEEYHKEELKSKEWMPPDAESGVKADIENGKKYALEWAKERMAKYRIRKKIKVIPTED